MGLHDSADVAGHPSNSNGACERRDERSVARRDSNGRRSIPQRAAGKKSVMENRKTDEVILWEPEPLLAGPRRGAGLRASVTRGVLVWWLAILALMRTSIACVAASTASR